MSVRIMSRAWDAELPSTDKLVLLALADWSNDDGHCWPSVAQLCLKSGLSERAIQGAIKRLETSGNMTRKPVPGKGVNYYVHPKAPPSMEGYAPGEAHYVYQVTDQETGEFYIGARTCVGSIENDKYMGSGKWVHRAMKAGRPLAKQILEECPSREALAYAEREHAARVFASDLCRNAKIPTPGTLSHMKMPPAEYAPRNSCAPQQTTETPARRAPNTSTTTISSEASASSHKSRKATFPAPQGVPEGAWTDFLQSPKRRKAGMSQTAYAGICRNLHDLAEHGFPPGEMIALAVERGWTTIKLEWVKNERQSQHRMGGPRTDPTLALVRAAVAAQRQNG